MAITAPGFSFFFRSIQWALSSGDMPQCTSSKANCPIRSRVPSRVSPVSSTIWEMPRPCNRAMVSGPASDRIAWVAWIQPRIWFSRAKKTTESNRTSHPVPGRDGDAEAGTSRPLTVIKFFDPARRVLTPPLVCTLASTPCPTIIFLASQIGSASPSSRAFKATARLRG